MRFDNITGSATLFQKLYRDYCDELKSFEPELPPFSVRDFRRSVLANMSLRKYFIMDENEGIVGFIILQQVVEIIPKPAWFIVDFYILPDKRRKGFGAEAFNHFLRTSRGDFFLYVLEKNAPAQEFWGSCIKRFELEEVYKPYIPVPRYSIVK